MLSRLAKLFLPALLAASFFSSCERNPCKDVLCPGIKHCLSGSCVCPNGYEGPDCYTLSSDKFTGSYNVYETCDNGFANFPYYTCYISPDASSANRLIISGLFNQMNATAYIYTDPNNVGNTISIPYQTQGALSVEGSGSFDSYNNRMLISFSYTYNFATYYCQHTFNKQ